jgi:hypothetical protein
MTGETDVSANASFLFNGINGHFFRLFYLPSNANFAFPRTGRHENTIPINSGD